MTKPPQLSDKSKPIFRPNPEKKLMDQVREVLRYHHSAYRTEQSHCQWILRYIRFFEENIGILHCSVNTLSLISHTIPEVFYRESIVHNGFLLKA